MLFNSAFGQIANINQKCGLVDTVYSTSTTLHGSLITNFFCTYADTIQNLQWKKMYPTYQWKQIAGPKINLSFPKFIIGDTTGKLDSSYVTSKTPDLALINLQQTTYKFVLWMIEWDQTGGVNGWDTATIVVMPLKTMNVDDSSHRIIYHPDSLYFSMVNPAVNYLDLSIPGPDRITIQLFDITGKLVLQQKEYLSSGNNKIKIDIANRSSGSYIVRIINNIGKSTSRILIKTRS